MQSGLIYLAGPLDGLDVDGTAWYNEFASVRADFVGFMPGQAYVGERHNPRAVDIANRAVIKESLAVLANLSGPGRALGTIREIEFAKGLRKPVYVVGDLQESLAAWDLNVRDSIEEVIQDLQRW